MTRARFFSAVSALALAFPSGAFAAAGQQLPRPTVDYSADVETQMDMSGTGQPMQIPGKVWSTKEKERREQTVMGMATTVIMRFDKKVTWVLMPGGTYIEQPIDAADGKGGGGADAWTSSDDLKMTKEGSETIDGMATTKHRVQVNAQKDGHQAASDGYVWISKENIPVKMEGSMTMSATAAAAPPAVPAAGAPAPAASSHTMKFATRLKNVKIGPQDAALFELPAGATKMDLPGMVPGMPGKPAAGAPAEMTPAQRDAQMKQMQGMADAMRKQMESMTPEQRKQLEEGMKGMQQQMGKGRGTSAPSQATPPQP